MMILVGFFLPPLMGLVTRAFKDSDVRFWVSTFICLVLGALYDLVAHNGSIGYTGMTWMEIGNSVAESGMTMVGIAKVSYEAVWNNQTVGEQVTDQKTTLLKVMDLKPTK